MPDILLIAKIVMLIFLALFSAFAIVVLNQVRTMNKIFLEIQSSETLRAIAIILVILAISLFLAALVIL